MTQYDDQVAVVMGASSGIGRRVALDLAARGAVVIGLAPRVALLETLQHDRQRSSPRSRTAVCDVAALDQLRSVLAEVECRYGRVDVLVNNAGVYESTPITDADHRHRARRVRARDGDELLRTRRRHPNGSPPACWSAAAASS